MNLLFIKEAKPGGCSEKGGIKSFQKKEADTLFLQSLQASQGSAQGRIKQLQFDSQKQLSPGNSYHYGEKKMDQRGGERFVNAWFLLNIVLLYQNNVGEKMFSIYTDTHTLLHY